MTITIPNELDDFVRAKLHEGGFESPSAVVTATLAAWQEEELKSSLLAAVGKPTHPYRKGEFVELARRVIAEDRAA